MRRKQIIDYFVYLAVRVLIALVQALDIRAGQRLARWLAWLFADVLKLRGKVVDENLAYAFPQLSPGQRRRLARQMWEHLFLLVLEVAHAARKVHETNWRDYARLRNVAPLVRLLLSDRPVILITGHLGNFEVGGTMLGILGFPTYTVARNLDNPYLDRFVARWRSSTGQHLIPKNGGYDQILQVLSRGGTLSFLADQYAGPKGCWVEFFGRPASTHKAIALLSLEHEAPMAVCVARRLEQPLRIEMHAVDILDPRQARQEVASIRELTQWYTSRLEEAIRQSPEQYWWLHRRWKDTRPPRRSGQRQAA